MIYPAREDDDDRPWLMTFARPGHGQPEVDENGIPLPPDRHFLCLLCSPPCETCPLRQQDVPR